MIGVDNDDNGYHNYDDDVQLLSMLIRMIKIKTKLIKISQMN